MKNLIYLLVFIVSGHLVKAELTPEVKEVLDIAYSGKRDLDTTVFERIKIAPFEAESHRVFTLIQAYSSTENPIMVSEALKISEVYVAKANDGWEKDFARIQLSMLLNLNGQKESACKLAERALEETDFSHFAGQKDSFLKYLNTRLGLSSIGFESYLKANLRREIGYYYLNRKASEGGPDVQKAYYVFSQIEAREIRESCLSDARFSKIGESINQSLHPPLPDPRKSPKNDKTHTQNHTIRSETSSYDSRSRNSKVVKDASNRENHLVLQLIISSSVFVIIGIAILLYKKRK